jgi:hypothetical protein
MTRHRAMRGSRKRDHRPRLLPVEGEETGWSAAALRWLRVTVERANLLRLKRGKGVRGLRRGKTERLGGEIEALAHLRRRNRAQLAAGRLKSGELI